jgi:oligoribonuclease (3'-5' exoribonuclease)
LRKALSNAVCLSGNSISNDSEFLPDGLRRIDSADYFHMLRDGPTIDFCDLELSGSN